MENNSNESDDGFSLFGAHYYERFRRRGNMMHRMFSRSPAANSDIFVRPKLPQELAECALLNASTALSNNILATTKTVANEN
jgi:hypothetical protein